MTISITITNNEASKIRINELLVTRRGRQTNGQISIPLVGNGIYAQDVVEAGCSITVTVHKYAIFTLSQRYDDKKVEKHSSAEIVEQGR